MATMRAAVVKGPQQIAVEAIPVPEPRPGEVRVRIEGCGLCGSDLNLFGAGFYAPGLTPGHEMAGSVDALGDGVEGFAAGDRVAVEPLDACGHCSTCRRGLPVLCTEGQIFGVGLPGGFAEYVAVPATRLFRLPAGLSPEVAALAEPMAVNVHGLRRGKLEDGQRVLVLGAGSIGLLATKAAVAMGAGEVWITARYPHQAALAERMGASRVLTEAEAEPGALAALGSASPFDLVVETVGGGAETLVQASHAVRPGGTISVVGVFLGDVTLPALTLFLKENDLVFSNCYAHTHEGADFEEAVRILGDHRDELAGVTTHTVPLDEIDRAFPLAADKKAGAVKVTVVP